MYASTYTAQAAAQSYQTVDVQTASPARLIALLLTGLDTRLAMAERFGSTNPNAAGAAISRSLDIIAELQFCLNLADGGEVAGNLYRIYQFSGQRLRQSDDRMAAVADVRRIIAPLVSAWNELAESAPQNATRPLLVA